MPGNLENAAVAAELENVSFHSNPKEGQYQRMSKLPHNCNYFTCWQGNAQNPQAKFQQYVNQELPDVQAEFREGSRTRNQIAIIRWIIATAREFQKNIYFCFFDYAKAFDSVDKNKL